MVGTITEQGTAGALPPTRRQTSTRDQRPQPMTFSLGLALAGMALLSFNVTRLTEMTPIADVAFLAATLALWGKLLTGNTRGLKPASERRTSSLILVGTILLLTGGTLSSFWSLDSFSSISVVLRLAWITILWFWLLRAVTPDVPTTQKFIKAFQFTMVLAAVIATSDYLGFTQFGDSPVTDRESAFFTHPNMLGGALAVVLPFMLLDIWQGRLAGNHKAIAFGFVKVGLVLAGLGATGSMTAMSAAVAGALTAGIILVSTKSPNALLGRRRPRANSLAPVVFIAVLGLTVAWFASTDLPVVERFTDMLSGEDSGIESSVSARPQQNLFVIDQLDSFLFVGVGHDPESTSRAWTVEGVEGSAAHNIFVKLLFEAGLIAVIGLVLILMITFRQGWILTVRSRGTELYPLMVALMGAFVAGNVSAQMNPVITERWYWLPTAFIGAMWALRHRLLGNAATNPSGPHAAIAGDDSTGNHRTNGASMA